MRMPYQPLLVDFPSRMRGIKDSKLSFEQARIAWSYIAWSYDQSLLSFCKRRSHKKKNLSEISQREKVI